MTVAATLTGFGTPRGAALPDPASALTPSQLDALSKVTSRDFDYFATDTWSGPVSRCSLQARR